MIISLLGVNLIYAFTSYFTKSASNYSFFSCKYILLIFAAFLMMAIYALLWQQIIKRMPVSEAYMYKGTVIIFTMCISALCFGESITINNILGTIIIVLGIALYARS